MSDLTNIVNSALTQGVDSSQGWYSTLDSDMKALLEFLWSIRQKNDEGTQSLRYSDEFLMGHNFYSGSGMIYGDMKVFLGQVSQMPTQEYEFFVARLSRGWEHPFQKLRSLSASTGRRPDIVEELKNISADLRESIETEEKYLGATADLHQAAGSFYEDLYLLCRETENYGDGIVGHFSGEEFKRGITEEMLDTKSAERATQLVSQMEGIVSRIRDFRNIYLQISQHYGSLVGCYESFKEKKALPPIQ
jgi:hypothetical protein